MTKLNALNALLGFSFSAVGAYAFFDPVSFFSLLPEYYGRFNLHFVKDAGIAFGSSGLLLIAALVSRQWKLPLAIGGALFVVLHGAFHVQMLLMGMAPTLSEKVLEVMVIITPAFLTALLVVLRWLEGLAQSKRLASSSTSSLTPTTATTSIDGTEATPAEIQSAEVTTNEPEDSQPSPKI